ncbi:MAG: hypothetical protein OEZ43_00085 [Gammaproteobacteria bacterium]|nr:hypothetical protein [Gammaproteobacteria bacterium]
MSVKVWSVLSGFIFATNSAYAVDQYTVTDLGPLLETNAKLQQDDEQKLKFDINNNGVVVGTYRVPTPGGFKAFVWDSSNGRQDLNTDSTRQDEARGINDVGQVVGWARVGTNNVTVMWTQNPDLSWSETFPAIVGQISGKATAIDNSGNIVGTYTDSSNQKHGFVWSSSTNSPHALSDSVAELAEDTNNGFVVGTSLIDSIDRAIFTRAVNDNIPLGSLNNSGFASYGTALNANGDVVGGGFTDANSCTRFCFGVAHAYLWQQATGILDLMPNDPATSWANDINDSGQIVGWRLRLPTSIAVLWQDSIAINLNPITANLGDWHLERAHAINNGGQIVGIGKKSGILSAFVLTPTGITSSSDLAVAILPTPSGKPHRRAQTSTPTTRFSIINRGPDVAPNIVVNATIPQDMRVDAINISAGNCEIQTDVQCTLNSLGVGESLTVDVTLGANVAAEYEIEISASGDNIDSGPTPNNSATLKISLPASTPSITSSDPETSSEIYSGNDSAEADASGTAQSPSGGFGCAATRNGDIDPLLPFLLFAGLIYLNTNSRRREKNAIRS